jgi:hypothetical protein
MLSRARPAERLCDKRFAANVNIDIYARTYKLAQQYATGTGNGDGEEVLYSE